MDANRLVEMTNLLTEKTKDGAVEWRQHGAMGEAYSCQLGGMRVTVSRLGVLSALGGTRISVVDESGAEVINVAEGEFVRSTGTGIAGMMARPIRLGAELGRLFELAQRSANQSVRAVDKIISELQKLR